jgi:hypothetical protein
VIAVRSLLAQCQVTGPRRTAPEHQPPSFPLYLHPSNTTSTSIRTSIYITNHASSYAHAHASVVHRQPLNRPLRLPGALPQYAILTTRPLTAGRLRGLRVSDSRVFGVILKQGTGSVNKAGLAVHDLAGAAAAATESGLLFATGAKARVGGFPLPLLLACFDAKGHIVLSIHFL